jgi:hypothetical protein
MSRHWIAVASAAHVRRGRAEGFMQVCHGKGARLARTQPGDGVVYYSPTETFGGSDRLQAFTAIGFVAPPAPWQADMGGGFRPFRREVHWLPGREAPIRPLLERLSFSAGQANWGYVLRFGLFAIPEEDFALIGDAMGVEELNPILDALLSPVAAISQR